MRFNKFVWELFTQSDRGKKAIERFSNLTDDFLEPWCRSIDLGDLKNELGLEIGSVNVPKLVHDAVSPRQFADMEVATEYYRHVLVPEGIPCDITDKNGEDGVLSFFERGSEEWYDYVTSISLGLYWAYPSFFLPYDFRCKFNQLEEIHAEFNIPLPPIPGKFKKEDRGLYYLSINQVWQEFRQLHGLSPAEMCAFLYDFAPQSTIPLNADDLPSPSKIWLITGGSWDIETVDKATPDMISRWGGNAAIRRGDILLLYLASPRKAISSVWRACTDGFIDPFFHYHGTVWICDPIKTSSVTFADLKNHPLLSEKPAIKANFFGPSSKASFTVEEYDAVLKIMESKGQDLTMLPRIPLNEQLPQVELQNERDVEVQLIEPFLKRLGYKETDWIRQMPVKMGRGERNYPDYVFGAKTKRGEESAKMILESKYQLSAQREFVDAFYQVKSYALRLQSKVMAMAAKEGVWVFPLENGTFNIKKAIHKTWADLAHPDKFHEVLTRIGRDDVLC
jgi:hypothetical protein